MKASRSDGRASGRAALVVGVVALAVLAAAIGVHLSSSGGTPPGGSAAHASSSTGAPPAAPAPPTPSLVAAGPGLRFGEPVAATTANTDVAAATVWLPTMAVVETWRRSGTSAWSAPQQLLPAGFHRGYDPSVAIQADGSVVVSSGVDLALRRYCLDGGSVAIERIDGTAASPPVLVDDQRGTSGFDDRPTVAAGFGAQVWVGWSHGSHADSCGLVGQHDQIRIAFSTDGGRGFSRPLSIAMPGGNFGVQIAPTGPGQAEVAWAQTFPSGRFRILVAQIDNSHLVGTPSVVGSGVVLPSHLPGASFPSFSLPSLTLIDGRPALTWAAWVGGRAVINIALPASSGTRWRVRTLVPPTGQDYLLPALGSPRSGAALLVNALHTRATDATAFQARTVALSPVSGGVDVSAARTVARGGSGPAFYELGESLQITTSQGASATGVVVAGAHASRLETMVWAP
jgi:hypothetical protein